MNSTRTILVEDNCSKRLGKDQIQAQPNKADSNGITICYTRVRRRSVRKKFQKSSAYLNSSSYGVYPSSYAWSDRLACVQETSCPAVPIHLEIGSKQFTIKLRCEQFETPSADEDLEQKMKQKLLTIWRLFTRIIPESESEDDFSN